MASAASITLGRFSLPVYEVYKVGADPFWLDGPRHPGDAGDPRRGGAPLEQRRGRHPRHQPLLAGRPALRGAGRRAAPRPGDPGRRRAHRRRSSTSTPAASRWPARARSPGDRRPIGRPRAGDTVLAARRATPMPPRLPRRGPAAPAGRTPTRPPSRLPSGGDPAPPSTPSSPSKTPTRPGRPAAAAAHDALRAMATRFAAAMAGAARDEAARPAPWRPCSGCAPAPATTGRWADADAIRRALQLLAVEVRDTPEGTEVGAGSRRRAGRGRLPPGGLEVEAAPSASAGPAGGRRPPPEGQGRPAAGRPSRPGPAAARATESSRRPRPGTRPTTLAAGSPEAQVPHRVDQGRQQPRLLELVDPLGHQPGGEQDDQHAGHPEEEAQVEAAPSPVDERSRSRPPPPVRPGPRPPGRRPRPRSRRR